MIYPIDKFKIYEYVVDGVKQIAAVSSYAGHTVKGYAKCDPRDEFQETGKTLAALRCSQKIAAQRIKRAERKRKEAETQLRQAEAHYAGMCEYKARAEAEKQIIDAELNDFASRM